MVIWTSHRHKYPNRLIGKKKKINIIHVYPLRNRTQTFWIDELEWNRLLTPFANSRLIRHPVGAIRPAVRFQHNVRTKFADMINLAFSREQNFSKISQFKRLASLSVTEKNRNWIVRVEDKHAHYLTTTTSIKRVWLDGNSHKFFIAAETSTFILQSRTRHCMIWPNNVQVKSIYVFQNQYKTDRLNT